MLILVLLSQSAQFFFQFLHLSAKLLLLQALFCINYRVVWKDTDSLQNHGRGDWQSPSLCQTVTQHFKLKSQMLIQIGKAPVLINAIIIIS